MVSVRSFEALSCGSVHLVTLTDETGCSAEFLSLGATVRALWVPDREGRPTDVVLGYESAGEYLARNAHLGNCIGRYANRIGGARFELNGKEYRLTPNEGENVLHGGVEGFDRKLWGFTTGEDSVTFRRTSPAGEEGFPGKLEVSVTYTLKDGCLTMDYRAVSDADTVVSLTNHSYFNLAGQKGGPVTDHVLSVRADRYTPCGAGNIPTGEILPVAGTALDLREPTVLDEVLSRPELAATRGLDHNLVLSGGEGPDACVYCPRTGIAMEVTTSMEGMQIYSAGFLTERPGKDGAVYGPWHAVCLETQRFPDAMNHANFPSPILRAGAEYHETTRYRFFVK